MANDVTTEGAGFGSDYNAATLIDRQGTLMELPLMSKRAMADAILNKAQALLCTTASNQASKPVAERR